MYISTISVNLINQRKLYHIKKLSNIMVNLVNKIQRYHTNYTCSCQYLQGTHYRALSVSKFNKINGLKRKTQSFYGNLYM